MAVEASSRRGFLRLALGEARRSAVALAAGLDPVSAEDQGGRGDAASAHPVAAPRLLSAVRATSCCELDEALAVALEMGLRRRLVDVRALARTSMRLTPWDGRSSPATALARGGVGDLDGGGQQRVVLTIDLAAVAELPVSMGLPAARGVLRVATEVGRDVVTPDVRIDVTRAHAPALGRPLALSSELVLPRVWSAPVQALGLEPSEEEAWERTRRALASMQGVEDDDAAVAWHRYGGYPDERTGLMPVICERATGARGSDADLERRAARWELLLQLTADPALGWDWGPGRQRLYLWIDRDASLRGQPSPVVAVAR